MRSNNKLTFFNKLFYGAGDISGSIIGTIVPIFYLNYLTSALHIRVFQAGIIFFIGTIWDAFTDPIVGRISDNKKSKYGRRRSFLILYSIPLALSFVALWYVSDSMPYNLRFLSALFTFLIFKTLLTLVVVPYSALMVEMTDDYDERSTLSGYRMFFSIFFGLIAVAIPEMIINSEPSVLIGHQKMALVFAVPVLIAPFLAFIGSKERNRKIIINEFSIKERFKMMWNNIPFRYASLMYFLGWTSFAIINAMIIFYIKFVLHRIEDFSLIMILVMGTATIFLPVWVYVCKKYEKNTSYIMGMSILVIGLSTLSFLSPASGDLIYLIAIIIGIGVSALHVVPWAIIPDSIEYGSYKSNSDDEGVYFGFLTFCQKLGIALAIQLVTIVLSISGFIEGDDITTQPQLTQMAIRINIGVIPTIMCIFGIIVAYFYPLSRSEQSLVREQLEQR